jgi:hypothetical protein
MTLTTTTTIPAPGSAAGSSGTGIPSEADLNRAPGLLEGAMALQLDARQCNLEYWLHAAAQGTLRGLVNGHAPEVATPDWMLDSGPLRDALIQEFGFRSIAEEKATRALSYLVVHAPDVAGMDFFATQLLDEARHASVFRGHLAELGIAPDDILPTIARTSGADADGVLLPLEEFGLRYGRDQADYIAGVAILTILVEGILAPVAELSERKWRLLDPAAAQIERAAGVDEIRHLTVGSSVVRQHLLAHPGDRARLLALVEEGRALWAELPVIDVVYRRELLFQEGMTALAEVGGDYEIWPGRRLIDTTPDERLITAATWSQEMQDSRLAYMGLTTEA